ncbi:peptide chain release factor N(5)-glutamine methyltransferase [Candidatus Pandoraea novymonadis]
MVNGSPSLSEKTCVPITVSDLFHESDLPTLETRILLTHTLGWSHSQLITRNREPLDTISINTYQKLCARRLTGEPIAYLTGKREFFGLTLSVNASVLIPRSETELLVELALEYLAGIAAPRVLDVGTGSGAIALAIATACPNAHVIGIDHSRDALAVARANAAQLGMLSSTNDGPHVEYLESNWYHGLNPTNNEQYVAPFDLIVSNPPYIPADDPHLTQGDLRYEPIDALTDHADGLSALRIIIAGASMHLIPGGWLLCEHGYNQAHVVRDLCCDSGLSNVFSAKDLSGIERVTGGQHRKTLKYPPKNTLTGIPKA